MPVKVQVGEPPQDFFVHSELLRRSSAFFDAALKQEWHEGKQRTVQLPEQDPETFNLYVQWLYSGRILSKVDGAHGSVNYLLVTKLYALGEVLLDNVFQDRIIDVLVTCVREKGKDGTTRWPAQEHVNTIYRGTTKGSAGRRLMVNMHVLQGRGNWLGEDADSCHHEFAVDLARALMSDRNPSVATDKKYAEILRGVPCSYHSHQEDAPCPAKKA